MTPETQGYIDIPNVVGNYCQVPYSAAFDMPYPWTIIAHLSCGKPWPTPTVFEVMGRANSTTQTAWRCAISATYRYLTFAISTDGTALTNTDLLTQSATGTPPGRSVYKLQPQDNFWAAWVYSGTTTPAKYFRGFVSADGITWQDAGRATISGGNVNPYVNSLPLNLGVGRPDVLPIAHKLFYCAVRPGTSGVETPSTNAPVFEFDAKTDLVGKATNATSFVSKSGHTVNVFRAGSTQTQIVAPAVHSPDPLPIEPNQPPLTVLRDFNGNMIPRARVTRTLTESFMTATSLPSWLQRFPGSNGQGIEVYPINGNHMVDQATGQIGGMLWRCMGANLMEGIQTTFDVNPGAQVPGTRVYEVLWALDGFRPTHETIDFEMGIAGNDCGVGLFLPRSSAGDPSAQVRLYNPPNGSFSTVATMADLNMGANTPGCRSLAIRIRPVEGFIYIEQEGEVYKAIDASTGYLGGPARCFAYINSGTQGGTPNVSATVRQVRFEITSN